MAIKGLKMGGMKAFRASALALVFCGSLSQSIAETFTVRDHRPISEALLELARRYGWRVNYVDSPFIHPDDLEDVTMQVAKGPIDHKILVPRRDVLTFSLPIDSKVDPTKTVRDLVQTYNRGKGAEIFSVSVTPDSIDVVPRAVKNFAGRFESGTSATNVLETPVMLLAKRRSVTELINEVCNQVSRYSRVTTGFASGPVNILDQTYVEFGASNEPARLVLDRAFANLRAQDERMPIPRLSWQALYAPDLKWYLLNVFPVTPPSAAK